MARVLAIESDPSQAAALEQIIREHVGAEAVLADSKEAAIAAIAEGVPDLIIVSALLSPRDESELANYLRALDGAEHVQILTIPQLVVANPVKPTRASGGLLRAFKRKRAKTTPVACDPDRYGDVLKGYLKLSVEARTERIAQRARDERTRQRTEAVRVAEEAKLAPATVDLVAEAAADPDIDLPALLAEEIIRPYERAPHVEEVLTAAATEPEIDFPAVPAEEIIRPYERAAPYVEEVIAAAEVDAPSERPAWLLPKPVEIEVVHRAVEVPIVELPASDDSATSDTAINEFVPGLAAASDAFVVAPLDEPEMDVPPAMAAAIVEPLELTAPYFEEVLAAAEVEAPVDVPAAVAVEIAPSLKLAAPLFEEILAAAEVEAPIDVPAAVAATIVGPPELAAPYFEEVLAAAEVEAPIDVLAAVAAAVVEPPELVAPYFEEVLAAAEVETPIDVLAAPAEEIVQLLTPAAADVEDTFAAADVEAAIDVPTALAAEIVQPLELVPQFVKLVVVAEVEVPIRAAGLAGAAPGRDRGRASGRRNGGIRLGFRDDTFADEFVAGLTAESDAARFPVLPDLSGNVETVLENILEDAPSLAYSLRAEAPALDRLPTEAPSLLFAPEPRGAADDQRSRRPVVTDPATPAASDIAIPEIAVEVIALPSFAIAVESKVLDAGTTFDLETAASPIGVDDRANVEPEIAATLVAVASAPSDLDASVDQPAAETTPMTSMELGPEAVPVARDEPKLPVHAFTRDLLRPLPAFSQPAEEPLAAMENDRIALSATSFEIDRRESDDYLLVAAREPARATRPVEPPGPPDHPARGAVRRVSTLRSECRRRTCGATRPTQEEGAETQARSG